MAEVCELSQSAEDQMQHTHEYLAAAAEDLQVSSLDWAASHSAVRSQAGMSAMGLPLTTRFR